MKKMVAFLMAGLISVGAYADGETKKACVDVKDKNGQVEKNKDGSVKQNCKEVKVHKKLEGTPVPEKK